MGLHARYERHSAVQRSTGYTLVEMVVVMIIIGVLAAVAVRALRHVTDTARIEDTRVQLDRLAWAISGNPGLLSGSARADYGYVGDVGALPPDLGALVTNPGLATWAGPYVHDDYLAAPGAVSATFAFDAWGKPYAYAGGNTITSIGGPVTLTRNLAATTAELLRNQIAVVVTDLSGTPPGLSHVDSVRLIIEFPRSGTIVSRSVNPAPDGSAAFDSIPIGRHLLKLVHLPSSDTITRMVTVDPGSRTYLELQWPEEVFR